MRSRLTRHSNKICALSQRCTTPYANCCIIYGYRGQLSVLIVRQDMVCLSYSRLPGPVTASHWPPPPKLSMEMGVWFYSWARMGVFFLVIRLLSGRISFHILISYPCSIIYHCCVFNLATPTTLSIHLQSGLYAVTLTPRPHPTTKQGRHTFGNKTTIATQNSQTVPFLSSPAQGRKRRVRQAQRLEL